MATLGLRVKIFRAASRGGAGPGTAVADIEVLAQDRVGTAIAWSRT
jgi:hypothetical protein